MNFEVTRVRGLEKAKKRRKLYNNFVQRQHEIHTTAKRQRSEASVQDDQRYTSPVVHRRRHSSTSTLHNSKSICNTRRTEFSSTNSAEEDLCFLSHVDPSLLQRSCAGMNEKGPFYELPSQPMRTREGGQEMVPTKSASCGDEDRVSSPASLFTDTSTSTSPHRLKPSDKISSVSPYSSACFGHLMNQLRVTELERNMIYSLLNSAKSIALSGESNNFTETAVTNANVHVPVAPTLWANFEEHKNPLQSSVGVSCHGTEGEDKGPSRLDSTVMEEGSTEAAKIIKVYPCVLIPASPPLGIDNFFEFKDIEEHENEHESPVSQSSKKLSQSGDDVEVIASHQLHVDIDLEP